METTVNAIEESINCVITSELVVLGCRHEFSIKIQKKLLMDVISQHFDEADDSVRYVQNRTGKIDVVLLPHIGHYKSTRLDKCACKVYKIRM